MKTRKAIIKRPLLLKRCIASKDHQIKLLKNKILRLRRRGPPELNTKSNYQKACSLKANDLRIVIFYFCFRL